MNIDIICPIYNAEKYILELDTSIKKQKKVNINKITYLLTESIDNTENMLKEINANYKIIKKDEFSHSITRENEAMLSNADIIVFVTQDIEILREDWLEKLISPIEKNEAEASYSRQIAKYNDIEKYTRMINYPENSCIKTVEDIKNIGLKAFFLSDVSSAVRTDIFKTLNGYDGKKICVSEDMYLAYKLIMNGYKIKYCADSVILHSHRYSLKQLYIRYYYYGIFLKENNYMDRYDTNKTGFKFALDIFKKILKNKDIKNLLVFLPNMLVRFSAVYIGKHKK